MLDQNFILVAALISFIGGANYLWNTLWGKTRPHHVTWFIWALAPLIAFAAQLGEGVGLIALTTFMAGFMPLLVFTASFVYKKAVWQATRFDYICGILAILGLILWLITGEGITALAFSILADALASLPTIVKSYTHPESESWMGYFLFAIATSITLLTIQNWSFINYGFSLYILTVNIILTPLILFKLGPKLHMLRVR